MRGLIPGLLMALLVVVGTARASEPAGDVVAKAFPAGDGLAVHLGADDVAFLAKLTNGGKRLVHGLALDDASRDKVRVGLIAAGVHPLADVATWHGAPRLPYADRLVNLLIVDADELKGKTPSDAECRRVVAPGGAVLACKGGTWKATTVERPKNWGDWTHFDGGPDGNAVSSDGEATGIRGLQWLDNVREVRWQKTGPHGGDGGNMRVWDRYAVIDMRIHPEDKDPKFKERIFLECRDVNNGLPIWQKPRTWDVSARRWSLAVADGQCFTWLDDKGQLTALDLATGKELRTYSGGEIKPWFKRPHPKEDGPATEGPKYGIFGDSYWVRCVGNTLVANGDGKLRAWMVDGKPLWTFGVDGQRAEAPVVDEKRQAVYVLMIEDRVINKWAQGPMMWQRWPTSGAVKAIVAVDLTTGKKKWENTDVASKDTGVMLGVR